MIGDQCLLCGAIVHCSVTVLSRAFPLTTLLWYYYASYVFFCSLYPLCVTTTCWGLFCLVKQPVTTYTYYYNCYYYNCYYYCCFLTSVIDSMAPIGTINAFDESVEDFESYCSRVELFFKANDLAEDKRVPAFLTLVGPKVYALARSLLSPKDPSTCTYKDIVKALKSHYKPKVVLIYERFKFYSRAQRSGESIADFVASLKALAHTCDFGVQLTDMLRDRFVMGLSNETTQHTLLAEADLTFEKAVDVASAREAALRDVQVMGGAKVHRILGQGEVTGRSRRTSPGATRPQPQGFPSHHPKNKSNPNSKPKTPCSGCGKMHWKRDCPLKDAECFLCHKKGHIRSMCFLSKSQRPQGKVHGTTKHNVNFSDDAANPNVCYDYVFSIGEDKVQPIQVHVLLDNVKVNMELDTGSACSIISKSMFESLWPIDTERPELHPSSANLRVYGGSPLKIAGEISVTAKLTNRAESCQAQIIIVDGDGPCLLGRNLIKKLELTNFAQIHKISYSSVHLKQQFPDLFSDGLGCLKERCFPIEVDTTVAPKFCKARTVPYALREKVNQELIRLEQEGIISPVTNSPWAAPIVPVLKPDGSVRICGDYKLTVNRAARLDTYPIPNLQDLFSGLAGGEIFSKLDMSQAYAQLCLEEDSKKYTVINTHRGLFKYNRLCFGVSSAPGIFQRAMENLLKDIPGVFCYLDDVLICGDSEDEHYRLLVQVLSKLQSAGLKLRLDKCTFSVPQVTYLGYLIDKNGIHPTKEKVHAIVQAPAPTNVTQLRAYLGLLNFYRRFLPQAASMLEPLNKLLRSSVPWTWGKDQADAFAASKEALLKSDALVHFDPQKPLVVVADSSAYGIGAVLCHLIDKEERPICFASRTLSSAERNYAQLEKEALAIVFALRKFHYYLWGQANFTLVTDHKPLLGLFSGTKGISPQASGRIQRWSLLLQAYNFTLRHRSGELIGTADALSRLPLHPSTTESTPVPGDWIQLVNFLESSPVTSMHIREQTRKDPVLSKVLRFCESGWHAAPKGDPTLTPYTRRKDELSTQNGCILWGSRVVVPPKLRNSLLHELHAGHAGSSRMKELARSYIWWPDLDADLEHISNSCPECLAQRAQPPKAELHPWEWPNHPWHRIHVDYAGPVNGRYFLVVVDAHSKWVDIYHTSGPTAKETIKCLRHSFSQFGLPVSIVSDNGPCFTSQEFKDFCGLGGIRHITTAVYKPASNGLAERMVQTFKKALHASSEPLQLTLDRFLFNYRLTPHTTTGVSPAELMFGRRLRSRLDLLWPADLVSSRVADKQRSQKKHHTGAPRHLSLAPESAVMIRNYSGGSKWVPSTITQQTGPLSYRCSLPSGEVVKRHQDQIIPREPVSLAESLPPSSPPASVFSPTLPFPPAAESPSLSQPEFVIPRQSEAPTSPTPVLRRSSRVRRPVERLNL